MNSHSQTLVVAIASDDGEHMPKGHFGAAPRFELYALEADNATWLRSIDNPRANTSSSPDAGDAHHSHGPGSSHQGGGIGRLLGGEGAQVMVSRAFGANIKRMRQRFLPVVVQRDRVSDAIALLQSQWERVEQHWQQGEQRKHLVLR